MKMVSDEEFIMRFQIDMLLECKYNAIINPHSHSISDIIKEITNEYKGNVDAIRYFYLAKARWIKNISRADDLEIIRRIEF